MKRLALSGFVILLAPFAAMASGDLSTQAANFQAIYGNPATPMTITKSKMTVGETRPKAVLRGVYYFGGTDGKRTPLSPAYQQRLCELGFSGAYSVYNKVDAQASCGANTLDYNFIGQATATSNGGARVAALMKRIYGVIKANGSVGPIYVHCYYGVHASNTISQMVLKQFCGISDQTAFANWDKGNFLNSLKAPGPANEKAKISAYQVDPSMTLTPAEKAIVCY